MISEKQWFEVRGFIEGLGDPCQFMSSPTLHGEMNRFFELLYRKNEFLNLTAIRDVETAVWKHLADSLALLQWESLGTVLDWGSGGGLPGIPLALARKESGAAASVQFLDSVGKKLRAVEEFSEELGLKGTRFLNGRGELLIRDGSLKGVDTIVMRAVAPAEKTIEWLHKSVGRWVLLLGPQQREPWERLQARVRNRGFTFGRQASYELPQQHGQRFLLELVRS